jgi:acyl-CoA thioester hydrolase
MQLEQDDIVNEHGILFVVHSLSIAYLKPALFNEALLVKTSVQKLSRASIVFEQLIVRQDDEGNEQVLTRGTVKVVSLGVEQKRPVPLPKPVYEQFANY